MSVLTVTAAAFKGHLNSPPVAVWAALRIIFGLGSAALGWFGWHHVERVVPSSLPDALHHQRSTVLRRGSAFFFVLGLVLAMGVFTAVGVERRMPSPVPNLGPAPGISEGGHGLR